MALTRLSDAPSTELKGKIISRFWRKADSVNMEDYASYFQFYERNCEALYLGIQSEVKFLMTDSHEHLLDIIDVVWFCIDNKQQCRRPFIRQKLERPQDCSSNDTKRKVNNSINLALRLWLTVDIREDVFAPAASTLEWDDTTTIQDFIKQQFLGPRHSGVLEKEQILLGTDFTAVNLRHIGGFKIEWTWNLCEHLEIDREARKLKIYTLKTCLYDQKSSQANIIPNALIDETLLTLRVLFPDWDPHTSRYLFRAQKRALAEIHPHPEQIYLSDFHYWQDRLSELCFEYQSPPIKWRQIWTDRRNRLQWYTFWLAIAIFIMTAVFGIISTITSCMQTKFAYESLKLARRDASASL